MGKNKQLHLGAFLSGTGFSMSSWRHAKSVVDGAINYEYHKSLVKKAEEGKLDFIFFGDGVFITEKSHPNFLNRFEPLTLLSALAVETSHIGLAATLTTTFSEPYNAARQFASIDHLSKGRAGWNVVTSTTKAAAENFGESKLLDHDLRYKMAEEFVEVTKGLWDSWEDDAFVRDQKSGVFFDPSKLHPLQHKGKYYSVKGPLNIARSKQGRPVIFQAGTSAAGQEFAAKHADAIFIPSCSLEEAKEYRKKMQDLAESFGRNRDDILVLPEMGPIVGDTEEEAEKNYQEIANLVEIEDALKFLGRYYNDCDFSQFDLDGPFPDLHEYVQGGWQGVTNRHKEMAKERNLTLRQVAIEETSPRTEFIGTPVQIADRIQEWFEAGAADGFMMVFRVLPVGLDDFVEKVIPILTERGLFRSEYEADTLRGHLGLSIPKNKFVLRVPQ